MIWLVVIKSFTLLVDHQHASVIQIAMRFQMRVHFLDLFSRSKYAQIVLVLFGLMSVHVYVVYCSSFGSMFRFMRLIDRTSFAATQNIFQKNKMKRKWNVFLGAGFFPFLSNKNWVVNFDNNLDIKFSQSFTKQIRA